MPESFSGWLSKNLFAAGISTFLLLAASLGAVFFIPIEVMPAEQETPMLYLRVGSRVQASPLSMERLLGLSVEGIVNAQSGIKRAEVKVDDRGVSTLATFKPGTDLNLAAFRLQEDFLALEESGLIDSNKVKISRFNPEASSLVKLSVLPKEFTESGKRLLEQEVIPVLEEIPEVVNVELVDFDTPITAFRLGPEVIDALGAGDLRSRLSVPTVKDTIGAIALAGGANFTLAATQPQISLLDFSQIPIREGRGSTLAQNARVTLVPPGAGRITNVNGSPAAFLEIFQREGTNVFSLKKNLDRKLNELRMRTDLSGIKIEAVYNKSDDVSIAIRGVFNSLLQSIIITFLVVYAFVRHFRSTLNICVTIPTTLLLTVLVLWRQGLSLNIVTISGLVMGIGMVVDSSILMMEELNSVFRSKGVSWKAAAEASGGVIGVLIQATIANMLIFVPVSFSEPGDPFTDLLRSFRAPILATLGASLVSSLVILPLISVYRGSLPVLGKKERGEFVSGCFRLLLNHRGLALGVLAIVSYFLAVKAGSVEEALPVDPADPFVSVQIRFDREVSSAERVDRFQRIEEELLRSRGSLDYRMLLAEFQPGQLNGQLSFFPVRSGSDPDTDVKTLESRLAKWATKRKEIAGVGVSVGFGMQYQTGNGEKSFPLAFVGPDSAVLRWIQLELREKLFAVPGVLKVVTDEEWRGGSELNFSAEFSRLALKGYQLGDISREVSAALSPYRASVVDQEGELVEAKVEILPRSGRWTLADALKLKVRSSAGVSSYWGDLGDLNELNALRRITRVDGMVYPSMRVILAPNLSSAEEIEVRRKVQQVAATFPFPDGFGMKTSGDAEQLDEMEKASRFVVVLSICLIYLFLGAAMEAVALPLLIMAVIPLAVVFGVSGLWLMGMELDVMARLSLVFLVGSSVNNAILLVDVIRAMRRQGYSLDSAIVEGCSSRFNSVLMSTSIQVIGALPIALGGEKIMGIPYASLGICLMSGMILSMLASFVLVPVLLSLGADLKAIFSNPAADSRPGDIEFGQRA